MVRRGCGSGGLCLSCPRKAQGASACYVPCPVSFCLQPIHPVDCMACHFVQQKLPGTLGGRGSNACAGGGASLPEKRMEVRGAAPTSDLDTTFPNAGRLKSPPPPPHGPTSRGCGWGCSPPSECVGPHTKPATDHDRPGVLDGRKKNGRMDGAGCHPGR